MNIKEKKIIKIALILILIIIMLLINWLFFSVKSFAKYQKSTNTGVETMIAKPVFKVDGASNIKIDGIEDTVYNFSVKNYDDTDISDVKLNYFIQIENDSNTDLEFILTKSGQEVELNNNQTNSFSLASTIKQEDNYELKIKYHNNPAIATDIEGNVQIKVEAMQVENT